MFGGKKLLREGERLDGILIESDEGKVLTNGAGSYHVKVRVTFEDGTTTEFDERLHTKDAGMRGLGAVVPVRYDPSDRSKIAVDGPEMRNRRETDEAQREAAFKAEPDPLPTSASPSAQLQALWEQKKALDARGSELRRTGAPREEVGAWVHESEAHDARFRALKAQHPDWAPKPSA
ncbi:MAG TPA: DUF3592 domain-containing protein [Solirubrobacterales bacterium]